MPAVILIKLTINNKATKIVQDYAYTHALKDEIIQRNSSRKIPTISYGNHFLWLSIKNKGE